MSVIDDPDNVGEELRQLKQRIRALETASPLANTSVERGRTRWYAGSEVLIEDSNLTVSGTAAVTGELNVTGDIALTGDMDVSGGGKITVQGAVDAVLGQTTWGLPGLQFGSAALVSLLGVLGVVNATGGVGVSPTAALVSWGAKAVRVTTSGTQVDGGLTLDSLPTISAAGRTPNLWIDPATKIVYRLI